jgi:hypothetical protein
VVRNKGRGGEEKMVGPVEDIGRRYAADAVSNGDRMEMWSVWDVYLLWRGNMSWLSL